MKNSTFVIDTSDTRMFYTMRSIRESGNTTLSIDNYQGSQPVIYCYSPSKRFTTDELLSLSNNSILIAGNITSEQADIIASKKIQYCNILKDEIFAMENASLTAEATLMLLIRGTNISMYDMRISILGYGRLGKSLANIFHSLGLNFAIHTDDYYERAAAMLCKCDVLALDTPINSADVIINTIPAKVLPLEKLQTAKNSCYILDLASFASCDNCDISSLGLSYDNALGLPGKHSPKSAGIILANAILRLDEVKLC